MSKKTLNNTSYKLCIVIPCYNEGDFFLHKRYKLFLQNYKDTLICFVNDGSSDNTDECILSLKDKFPENVSIVNHKVNSGKAQAVKTGMNYCNSNFDFEKIAYLDADLAVSLEECYSLSFFIDKEVEFVFGSRILRIGATIIRKTYRHYIGRIIATLISYILSLKVYDTQCGCKIFKKEVSEAVFIKPFISKWLFDVEIFFRILEIYGKKLALQKMLEIPLEKWIDRGDSKVQFSYFFKLWLDLLNIKKQYSKKNNQKKSYFSLKPSWVTIVSIIIATTAFHVCYGLEIIIPTNISWLLSAYHDWGQHYLGWAFFRDAPWTFPLGEMTNYYYPVGTNVGFTDSIPLLALLLKPFSSILPNDFQYLGFFMYTAFVLGAIYTLKILKLFNINKIIGLIAVIFIITSPLFIFRGMHPALTAHWLILASIYYYLVPSSNKNNAVKNNWKQLTLFFLSTTIHPYLAAMIFGFCIILPIKNFYYEKSINRKKLIVFPILSLTSGLFFWFILGLIGFGKSTGSSAGNYYGENTFNLNSFFNSFTYYSNFFSGLPKISDGQHEGFSYLGLGMMVISLISVIYFIFLLIKKKLNTKKQHLPLFILVILMLLFSISNIVTLGDKVLFEVPIPSIIKKLGSIFRGTGRFCWPFYYSFTLFSIVLFSKLPIKNSFKISLLSILIVVQLCDIENILTSRNLNYGTYKTKLNDEKWVKVFSNFDKIITYPPFEKTLSYTFDYQDLMYLADKVKKPITTGYVARSKPIHKYTDSLNRMINKPNFFDNNTSLIVTTSKHLEVFQLPLIQKKASLYKIDNFYLIFSKKKDKNLLFTKNNDINIDSILSRINKSVELKSKNYIEIDNSHLENKNEVRFGIDEIVKNDNSLKIRGWAFDYTADSNLNDSIFISLSNEKKSYLFKTDLTFRPDVTKYFKRINIDSCGFNSLLFLKNIPYDSYKIGFVIKNKEIVAHKKISDSIQINP
ncbi:DUF6311 domain-containing protein [Polaribacter porphyrae]|uniref:Uncharacterized protein n=1 Tax=Polaribacter porphyrae TaxID=1137780 RepID=A0A2S7WSH3_9FLAO|nr:DUF6311 domain-containing protein [Polaribacter porphyrae]PQJ80416.1 hypothetical protein BTO18_15100 [Polaribacter porphyrae]